MEKARKSIATGMIFFLFMSAGLLAAGCSFQLDLGGRQAENSAAGTLEPAREAAAGLEAEETGTPESRVPPPLPPVERDQAPAEEIPSERELPAADTGLPADPGFVEVIIVPEDD